MCQPSLPARALTSKARPGNPAGAGPGAQLPDMGPARCCPFGRHRAGDPVKLLGYRPVVKLQERPLSGFPPASLMLVEMVAVYFVLAAKVTFGFSVATRLVAL
jgi:hypothetical protein